PATAALAIRRIRPDIRLPPRPDRGADLFRSPPAGPHRSVSVCKASAIRSAAYATEPRGPLSQGAVPPGARHGGLRQREMGQTLARIRAPPFPHPPPGLLNRRP